MSWKTPFGLAMGLAGALLVIPVSTPSGFGPMWVVIYLAFAAMVAVGAGLVFCLLAATRPLGIALLLAGLGVPAGFFLTLTIADSVHRGSRATSVHQGNRAGSQAPTNISVTDPRVQVLHFAQAEPVHDAFASDVMADIVVGVGGSVESVAVTSGPNALRASASNALKRFRFVPLVIGGKAARFTTQVTVRVPDGRASISVPPAPDVTLLDVCSRAVITRNGSPPAIQMCLRAAAAADLAGNAANRQTARRLLGNLYEFALRWPDAVAAYQSALDITTASDADDFRTGEILRRLAGAQLNVGILVAADRNAESSAATLQTSMAAHPEHREEHVAALRETLSLHATIKNRRGDHVAQETLERLAWDLARELYPSQ